MANGFTNPLSAKLRAQAERIETDDTRRFVRVMDRAFDITQEDVHVDTSDLKDSGQLVIEHPIPGVVTGEIVYGASGPASEYAIYEQRRGGSHDYMARALDYIQRELKR